MIVKQSKATTAAQIQVALRKTKAQLRKDFGDFRKESEKKVERRAEAFKQAVIQKLQMASTSTGASTSLGDGIPALIEAIEVKKQIVQGQSAYVVGLKNPKAIDKTTGKSIEAIARTIEYGTSKHKPLGVWGWVARRIGNAKDTGR